MRVAILLLASFSLTACEAESTKALRELQLLRTAHPSGRELCNAKRKVEAAYLRENDATNYQSARLAADTQCINADITATLRGY